MNELVKLLTELQELGNESGYTGDSVGNEAIGFDTLRSHFTKVNKITLKVLGYFKNTDDYQIVSLSPREVALKRNVLDAGFASLRTVEVYKPSAFVGNAHDFVSLLEEHHTTIKSLESSLTAFENNIAQYANNPEDLTKHCSGLRDIRLPNAGKLLEEFSDFFMGKSGIDSTKFGKMYGSTQQFVTTGNVLVKLTESFNGSEVRAIKERGDSLYKTLEYVEEALEDKGLQMTRQWRHEIGKQLYVVTEWLGIYSLYITKLVAASVAHRDSVAKLNRI